MEQTTLSIEREKIIAYIAKYGDTRLSDLVNYGTLKLKLPEEQIKTLLNDMVFCGELVRVVHEEFEPPIEYLKWSDVPDKEGLQVYSLFLSGRRLDDNELNQIKAILGNTEETAQKEAEKKLSKSTKLSEAENKVLREKTLKILEEINAKLEEVGRFLKECEDDIEKNKISDNPKQPQLLSESEKKPAILKGIKKSFTFMKNADYST